MYRTRNLSGILLLVSILLDTCHLKGRSKDDASACASRSGRKAKGKAIHRTSTPPPELVRERERVRRLFTRVVIGVRRGIASEHLDEKVRAKGGSVVAVVVVRLRLECFPSLLRLQ